MKDSTPGATMRLNTKKHLIRWYHRLYIWLLETRTDIDGIQYKYGFGRLWIIGEEKAKKPRL